MDWIGDWVPQGGSIPEKSHCWHRCHPASRRRPRSRGLLWFSSHDGSTRGLSCQDLLLPSSSSTIDTLQSWTRCDRTTCFSISNLTTGLLQLCAYSFTGVNARTTPESPQRCCSVGSWFGTTWTRDTGDVWTSLVANCRENQVQTLPFGIPCMQSMVVHRRIWPSWLLP